MLDVDVVRRVTVQRSAETLLVKMVTDETDATSENEETIEGTDLKDTSVGITTIPSNETNLDVLLSLLGGEGTAIPEKINEADGDATINIQDELSGIMSRRRGS